MDFAPKAALRTSLLADSIFEQRDRNISYLFEIKESQIV
jgi:hypothetical protein